MCVLASNLFCYNSGTPAKLFYEKTFSYADLAIFLQSQLLRRYENAPDKLFPLPGVWRLPFAEASAAGLLAPKFPSRNQRITRCYNLLE